MVSLDSTDCSLDTYSDFQVNIFSNNRDITICFKFYMMTQKTKAIPQVFSENSRATKNWEKEKMTVTCIF